MPAFLQLAPVKRGDPLGSETQSAEILGRHFGHRLVDFTSSDFHGAASHAPLVKFLSVTQHRAIALLLHCPDDLIDALLDVVLTTATPRKNSPDQRAIARLRCFIDPNLHG